MLAAPAALLALRRLGDENADRFAEPAVGVKRWGKHKRRRARYGEEAAAIAFR